LNKKIIVHIGPPKTGTSVLQNWFVNNIEFLKRNSVYYPEHKISPLGISSGNVHEVLDFNNERKSVFSNEKFNKLIKEFSASNFNYLLISSEYFFYQVDGFLKYTLDKDMDIKLIAYIRPEFEIVESSYNQSIKRNGQFKSFNRQKGLNNREIKKITEYVNTYGKEYFSLRSYGSKGVFEKDIIDDFLSELDIEKSNDFKQLPIINGSYAFECLEFKRWINQYTDKVFDNELDLLLQGVAWGNKKYSLLPEELFESYKKQSLLSIQQLNQECPIINFSLLEKYINNKQRKPYTHQKLEIFHFDKVASYLIDRSPVLVRELLKHIREQESSDSDEYVKKLQLLYFTAMKKRSKSKVKVGMVRKLFKKLKNLKT
jgi:hypothetical protein